MLSAAKQLEALDVGLARETYLEAFTAALFVGRLSPAVGDVARAARMAPAPRPRRAPPICSWMAWRCWSRRAMRPGRPP
jgi:hypothetical protein